MNDQRSEITPTLRTARVRVHVPPRSLDQRRRDRAAGVDAAGRPTARSLGISPRQLMDAHGISRSQAAIASRELLRKAHQEHEDTLRDSDQPRL